MPNNPYLPDDAGANPYLEPAAELQSEGNNNLQRSLYASEDKNPDETAKHFDMAEKLAVPPSLVASDPKAFENFKYRKEAEELSKGYPKTAQWLQEPDNVAVSKDDMSGLSKIENSVNEYSTLDKSHAQMKAASASFFSTVFRFPALGYDLGLYPVNVVRKTFGAEEIRTPNWLQDNIVSTYYDDMAKQYNTEEVGGSIGTELSNGNFSKAGSIAYYKFLQNSPQLALMLASGGLAGAATASVGAGTFAAAAQNAEAQKAPGVSQTTAVLNAAANGIFEGVFENVGTLGVFKSTVNDIAKKYGTEVSKEFISGFAKTLVKSSATEGAEEFATQVAQDLNDYVTGVNPDALKTLLSNGVESFLVGATSGAALTGPAAFSTGMVQAQQARKANLNKDFYLSLGTDLEATKLRSRLPSKLREFSESVTKDTAVNNIYISPESVDTYFQSKNISPVEAAQALGFLKEYTEAKSTGQDLKIPTSTWAHHMVGTEHYEALSDDIKFQADDFSVNEIKAAKAEIESKVKEIDPIDTATEQIHADTKAQLIAAGVPDAEAHHVATVNSEFYRTQGLNEGIDPAVLYKERGIVFNSNPNEGLMGPGTKVLNQSPVNAPAFYSKLERVVSEKVGKSASVEQVNAVLNDVKAEEREWSGIQEFLKDKKTVSKEDLLNFIKANQLQIKEVVKGGTKSLPDGYTVRESRAGFQVIEPDGTSLAWTNDSSAQEAIDRFYSENDGPKFSRYTLPGGENYREVLFTLPYINKVSESVADEISQLEKIKASFEDEGNTERVLELQSEIGELKADVGDVNNFRSTHFDEANVLAHTRLNDRVDAEGNKVLFIEEIQSDWHQAGRKKGYVGDLAKAELVAVKKDDYYEVSTKDGKFVTNVTGQDVSTLDQASAVAEARRRLEKAPKRTSEIGAVPNAPFKKTWQEFVLKRLIREAAEKGYDKLAWTTGEQQAERYDLSKQISKILVIQSGKSEVLRAYGINGDEIFSKSFNPGSDMSDFIGKEANQKLSEMKFGKKQPNGVREKVLKGLDLKVGGEGMKGFYDKILVNAANTLVKKTGVKVGETSFVKPETRLSYEEMQRRKSGEEVDQSQFQQTVHSLEITPELKKLALGEGFPLFQSGEQGPRGQIKIGPNKSIQIDLFKSRDASTTIHELGHAYLEITKDLASRPNASEQIQSDFKTIQDWVGAKPGEAFTTEQHEQFARGFEAYLREGKAPSKALTKAFHSFWLWLTNLYKTVDALNVEVSPEIRGVFSRMLATNEEVKQAEVRLGVDPLFDEPKLVGMNETQTRNYIELRNQARQFAEGELNAKLMKDLEVQQSAAYASRKKEVEAAVTAEVNKNFTYRAISILQKGVMPDGSPLPEGTYPIKLDRTEIMARFGKGRVDSLPRGIFNKETGILLETAAEMLGFKNGETLLKKISSAPKRQDFIDSEVERTMRELYPELLTSPKLKDEAMAAVHNEARASLLRTELEWMASNDFTQFKGLTKKLIQRAVPSALVKQEAKTIIESKTLSEVRPYIYERAERKAAKEAAKLFSNGDIQGAFEAKTKELLNHELYKAAIDAQFVFANAKKEFKKLSEPQDDISKTRSMNLVSVAQAVLAQHGMGRSKKTANELLDPMRKYDPEQYETLLSLMGDRLTNPKPISELTYGEFLDLKNTVSALWSLAKSEKQILVDGKNVLKETAIDELALTASEFYSPAKKEKYRKTKGAWDKTKALLLTGRSFMRRVESFIDIMDLGDINGSFRTFVFNPISQASDTYRAEKTKVLSRIRDMVKVIEPGIKPGPIASDELQHEFREKHELLGALLHTGNKSNLSKLLRGWGWGSVSEEGILDTSRWDQFINRMIKEGVLTKADFDFVQNVWDLMEELKPLAQKAHKELYGYYFNEITTDAFTNQFGTYRGGYVPAKSDPAEFSRAIQYEDQETLSKMSNTYAFPTVGRGATMNRVESFAVPLQLNLRLITSHVDWLLKFSHIEPRAKEVGKILNDKRFREAMDQIDPVVVEEMLVPWLQRSARQQSTTPLTGRAGRASDAGARFLRTNAAMNMLSLNVTNALQNSTGYLSASTKVSPRYLKNATWNYSRGFKGGDLNSYVEDVTSKSVMMKNRLEEGVIEIQNGINDILITPSKARQTSEWAKKHGYVLQRVTQGFMDTVVWGGAYDQSVAEGLSEKDAIKFADSVVRTTQASANPEDISRMEAGSDTVKLLTMFQTFFNTQANLVEAKFITTVRQLGLKKSAWPLLYIYSVGFMLPAIVTELISRGMAGKFDKDDDDEYMDDVISVFFGSQARFASAMFPIVGPFLLSSVNRFNDNPFDDKFSLSPAFNVLESVAGVGKSAYDVIYEGDDLTKRGVRDLLSVIGIFGSVPTAPLGKPISYLMDVNSGDADPTGPIDFTRGLLTGKPGQ